MIAYIKGKIIYKGKTWIIVNVNNVGYKVFVNEKFLDDSNKGDEVELFTYQHVREDAVSLYGFRLMEELDLFEMLLSISGIGPRSAISVLAVSSVADVKESIALGDSSLLTKVSGIGKKTAERVVLELREKIDYIAPKDRKHDDVSASSSSDEIDALIALGYSLQQAREALKQVDPKIKSSGERIKQALQRIQN